MKLYIQNLLVYLYSILEKKLKKQKIYEIIKEAVMIESEFIGEALPCKLIGMNQYYDDPIYRICC